MKTLSSRWAQLKENSTVLLTKNNEFMEEFNPLVKYLEKLSKNVKNGLLVRYPVTHMISLDH